MQILNLGSINIDHVYEMEHFVRPGETLSSSSYSVFAGGKGFNQSVALARAGAEIRHAGRIGGDGLWLRDRLEKEGVDVAHVETSDAPTGHAIIQVIPSGENAIVLHGGANQQVSAANVSRALATCSPGDWLLVQNETSSIADALREGKERKLRVIFNPAPMDPAVPDYPLHAVDIFILNQTEAEGLTGELDPDAAGAAMRSRYPDAAVVLTLGSEGAVYFDAKTEHRQPATRVDAVDTTAAGDTFTGYFLSELMRSGDPAAALALGCRAAAICVTREGASVSIPMRDEVKKLRDAYSS